jgi:small subunit ribosomal protein S2
MQMPKINDLLELGAHFGHKKEFSHPKAQEYVYLTSEGVDIIDLEKTIICLENAIKYLQQMHLQKKSVVFVGTKRQIKEIIKETAQACDMPYVTSRWLGGTFTNFETIKKRISNYKELKNKIQTEKLDDYTKKEKLELEKKVAKLSKFFLGLENLDKLPDAMLIIDPKEEKVALKEAKKMNIPVIAVCNTNIDVSQIDYPIMVNDNSSKTIKYICDIIINTLKDNNTKK